MSIRIASSIHTTAEEIVADLRGQLSLTSPTFVICFASSSLDIVGLAHQLHKNYPLARTIGCTTAGEIISGKMLSGSTVAMAFDAASLPEVHIQVFDSLVNLDRIAPKCIFQLETSLGRHLRDLEPDSYVGLTLIDGVSKSEEKMMDLFGDTTPITILGGSAGDDLQFRSTQLFADGQVYDNAALLAVMRPAKGFAALKVQSFSILEQKLIATRVNEENREVLEFNELPAVQAYSQALGVEPEDLPSKFMRYPLGLILGGEPYVRSPAGIKGQSIMFYCTVPQGMELSLLKSDDIITNTRHQLGMAMQELGSIEGLLNFNCTLRAQELESHNQCDLYAQLFSNTPTIGFNTYGEEYIGHLNQTATMLVFKG